MREEEKRRGKKRREKKEKRRENQDRSLTKPCSKDSILNKHALL